MADFTQKPAPSVPAARPLSGKAAEEFTILKRQLDEIASWEMAPNKWADIQIIYTRTGGEDAARGLLTALALPTPEM